MILIFKNFKSKINHQQHYLGLDLNGKWIKLSQERFQF